MAPKLCWYFSDREDKCITFAKSWRNAEHEVLEKIMFHLFFCDFMSVICLNFSGRGLIMWSRGEGELHANGPKSIHVGHGWYSTDIYSRDLWSYQILDQNWSSESILMEGPHWLPTFPRQLPEKKNQWTDAQAIRRGMWDIYWTPCSTPLTKFHIRPENSDCRGAASHSGCSPNSDSYCRELSQT